MTHVQKCNANEKCLNLFFIKIHHLGHTMMVDSLSKVGFKTAVTLISTFTACPLEKVMLQITFSENQLQSKQD